MKYLTGGTLTYCIFYITLYITIFILLAITPRERGPTRKALEEIRPKTLTRVKLPEPMTRKEREQKYLPERHQ